MTSYVKRQVAETRPLFWACVIIVAMLSVFGFAQAGLFQGGFAGPIGGQAAQPPAQFVSREEPARTAADNTTSVPAGDALLDLNDSVFETGKQTPPTQTPTKRRFTSGAAKTETTATVDPAKTDPVPATVPPQAETKPAAEPGDEETKVNAEVKPATPRAYVRGPMGGCFYLTASGSKRYVDRTKCN